MKTSEKNSLWDSTVRRENKPPTFHEQYYKNTLGRVNCVTVSLTGVDVLYLTGAVPSAARCGHESGTAVPSSSTQGQLNNSSGCARIILLTWLWEGSGASGPAGEGEPKSRGGFWGEAV